MSLIKFHLRDSPEHRELLRKMGAGDKEAIEYFKEQIASAVIESVDEVLAGEKTGHKDFFGKDIYIGDEVALLQKAGSSSVYIRKGVVTGFTSKKVKVRFRLQGVNLDEDSTREPYNVIKS